MESIELLKAKALEGFNAKGLWDKPGYRERLDYELSVVEKLGFATYFLVLWDVVQFCEREGVLRGPGRGSGASSLMNYCLGITLVDPIKYGLYFGRFLAATRVSPPDVDFDTSDRDRIITYLEGKYGRDRVCRVGTINFMRTKSAIRDIGRVLEKEFTFVEELSGLVPPPVAGLWESFEDECKTSPKLLDPKYQDVMEPVGKLWGVARSRGTHAGGVAIAPGPINRFVPLYKDKDGNLVSQFDWRDLESAGLLKYDILGLQTLEVIQLCLKYLRQDGVEIDLYSLEDGDKDAYDLICSGNLDGVFQLGGSPGIKQLTVEVGPRSIEDLSLVTSLFRPGPISTGQVEAAVRVRKGLETAEYPHPDFAKILDATHGMIVYQEQLMKVCIDICGYSEPEADSARKTVAKKVKDKMQAQIDHMVEGAITHGVDRVAAKKFFSSLEKYAEYLFVKSHATAYSVITYWTAVLKAKWPIHFYSALLACESKPENIVRYACAIKEAGITILPPDINLSGVFHQPEGKAIRFGLGHIKGMPQADAEKIVAVREEIRSQE